MIRVYFLPVLTIAGGEVVAGAEYIHDALLECTDDPMERKLIQVTTDDEHTGLVACASSWREAKPYEVDLYNAMVIILPPDPDYVRACEILHNPSIPMPAPDVAEILRIFGRRLGYDF